MKTLVMALTFSSIIIGLTATTTAQANLQETFVLNQLMAKLDSNRNGLLDLSELQTQWNKGFNTYDAGHDKLLSYIEFERMIQSQRARASRLNNNSNMPTPAKLFVQIDTNNDQWISHQEYIGQRMKAFQSVDRNRDNALNKDELKAAKGRMQNLR